MKIAFSGSSGLVGKALVPRLKRDGHQVTRLVRREPGPDEARWDPKNQTLDASLLQETDVVIHLGGENIAEGRWNTAKKQRIRESRVQSTQLLAKTIAAMDRKPQAFVCASAIGFYGDRDDETMSEGSPAGNGFLSEVCQEWESATQPAKDAGIRVVNMRIGVVLSSQGAALKKMMLPFKMGGGGILGSGKQYWSCVSRPELVEMLNFAVENETIHGPVNAVSSAVTNHEFTKTLGKLLGRPTILPMPAFAVKLLFGEMGEELMLASTRVVPDRLKSAGYTFMDSNIEDALKSAIADTD